MFSQRHICTLFQTDIFEVRAIDLGTLKKVTIGHTKKGRGKGWFCDQVKIRTTEDADTEVLFPCNQWMDTGAEDRKLERVLEPLGEIPVVPEGEEDDMPESSEFKLLIH